MRRALLACLPMMIAACGLDREPAPAHHPPEGPAPGPTPVVPVGLDAYRMWDRLPTLRYGVRAYMRSTYDRSGGNEGADASHFLRQDADDFNVTLDVEGPGVLYFVRTNHWHGSPWHYVVDGVDHVVTETSTADPEHPTEGSVFLPSAALPSPLTQTWSTTRGADLNWVPIPFEQSFTLAYGRTHYGTGYYIYHSFADAADGLSAPLKAWDEAPPDPAVVAWFGRAGEDLAPVGEDVTTDEGTADVPDSGAVTLLDRATGPRTVRALRLRAPADRAIDLSRASIRVTWDGLAQPSIDAPVALFFGAGSLYDRTGAADLVKALMSSIRFQDGEVRLSMYWPMPFAKSARVELVGGGAAIPGVGWSVTTEPLAEKPSLVGYFHATYRDHGVPTPGRDLVLLDTTLAEGGGDFCGHVVGTSFTFSDQAIYSTLEGDPRFFFDDSMSPQAYGTGTEEWGGGGDYWGGQTMTLPLVGHPVGSPTTASAQSEEDKIESAYRHLVADVMPFGKNARLQLEHGGVDGSTEHYRTIAYWYGRPGACLVQTDALHVGDPADEAAHAYGSPTASGVDTVTSRWEWGVDQSNGVEVQPETTDTGRHMTGDSEFTLQIERGNVGVMLRRRLDYAFADQRAEVFVAGVEAGAEFERAGVWYLAGSNTCVYSNPPGELGAAQHTLETSNRRLREDEFLVPRRLTAGRSAIRVRVRHAPRSGPIVPGGPEPERAWSELRYWAYSYVLPSE